MKQTPASRSRYYGANVRNEDLTEKAGDVSKGEYNIQFKNFEMVRDMDGVYKVTALRQTLQNTRQALDFLFSVNRFGSTYVYADEATESKVTRYYIKDTEEPLKILELSPVELKTHTAELFKDHNRNTLAEDTQYTFNPAKVLQVSAPMAKDIEYTSTPSHRKYMKKKVSMISFFLRQMLRAMRTRPRCSVTEVSKTARLNR